jgi:hypothetical protein
MGTGLGGYRSDGLLDRLARWVSARDKSTPKSHGSADSAVSGP